MTDIDQNVECINMQLEEIDMLQSMFPEENEIEFDDITLLVDAKEFVKSPNNRDLRHIRFKINLKIEIENKEDNFCNFSLAVNLPSCYPNIKPNISVSSNNISRPSQTNMNQDLKNYLETLDSGNVQLFCLITWIQENGSSYHDKKLETTTKQGCTSSNNKQTLHFMWLYMHHIYSKNKRRDILNWASELELTGFSLPGKPGVVYLEGTLENVDDYFDRLRRMNWKRLTCKLKEPCDKRKFDNFTEISFDCHGGRDYHMDMGKFYEFLQQKELGHMFKVLFGIEGHSVGK